MFIVILPFSSLFVICAQVAMYQDTLFWKVVFYAIGISVSVIGVIVAVALNSYVK